MIKIHKTIILNYTGTSHLTRVIVFVVSPDVMFHCLLNI